MAARPQVRHASAITWAWNNPVLLPGEIGALKPGFRKFKIGDGVTAFNDLEWYQTSDAILSVVAELYAPIEHEHDADAIVSGELDVERIGYSLFGSYNEYTLLNGWGEFAPVTFEPFATADRPDAGDMYVGAGYWDSDLNMPGWSDGTDWRDAAGNII